MVKVYVSLLLVSLLCLITLLRGDIMIFWLFFELGRLSLIPCFMYGGSVSVFDGLLSYIYAISISSSLMLVGVLYSDFFFFFLVGVGVKFCMFPFIGWIYSTFLGAKSWIVCWCISVLMKVVLVRVGCFVCRFYGWILMLCVFLGLLFSGLSFWVNSSKWFIVWCHMTVRSSCLLIYILWLVGVDAFCLILVYYSFWATGVLVYFSKSFCMFRYMLWLISFPLSFRFWYKVIFSYFMVGSRVYVLVVWFIYCFLEQLYLIKWVVRTQVVKSMWCASWLRW